MLSVLNIATQCTAARASSFSNFYRPIDAADAAPPPDGAGQNAQETTVPRVAAEAGEPGDSGRAEDASAPTRTRTGSQAAETREGPQPAAETSKAESGEGGAEGCPYVGLHRNSNFMDAQGLWDAGMAHSISSCFADAVPGGAQPLVIHVCGKLHSEARLPFLPGNARDCL